jgi:hypothetical protein
MREEGESGGTAPRLVGSKYSISLREGEGREEAGEGRKDSAPVFFFAYMCVGCAETDFPNQVECEAAGWTWIPSSLTTVQACLDFVGCWEYVGLENSVKRLGG